MSITGLAAAPSGMRASLDARYQLGSCAELGFGPKASARLSGSVRRGGHPAFRTVVTMPRGEANLRRVALTMPETELLESRHIRTVCSRARFADRACPSGSIYGRAKIWTPLLDRPLEGPVYLRTGRHRLPDLVASLDGQLRLDLVGRLSAAGARLRANFTSLPDAPLTRMTLTLEGGSRGLLVNTGGLCAREPRVSAAFAGQNGKVRDMAPILRADCGESR